MDTHLPTERRVIREVIVVFLGVAATELLARLLGLSDWTGYALRRWPDLLQRHGVIFPLLLVLILLVIRLWSPARDRLIAACWLGAIAGLAASIASLLIAQSLLQEDRARLLNSITEAAGTFVVIQIAFGLLATLGWLHGALASVLSLVVDRFGATSLPNGAHHDDQ